MPYPTISNRLGRPSSSARPRSATTIAAAPSLISLALPAVTSRLGVMPGNRARLVEGRLTHALVVGEADRLPVEVVRLEREHAPEGAPAVEPALVVRAAGAGVGPLGELVALGPGDGGGERRTRPP